jgi:hypothetical protein
MGHSHTNLLYHIVSQPGSVSHGWIPKRAQDYTSISEALFDPSAGQASASMDARITYTCSQS